MEGNRTSTQSSRIDFRRDGEGFTRIEIHSHDGVIWLSTAQLAEVLQTSDDVIRMHIENILREGELDMQHVRLQEVSSRDGADGMLGSGECYDLDMLIAVGYRTRTRRGMLLRRWATEQLTGYLRRGFLLDESASDRLDIVDRRQASRGFLDGSVLARAVDAMLAGGDGPKGLSPEYALFGYWDRREALRQLEETLGDRPDPLSGREPGSCADAPSK